MINNNFYLGRAIKTIYSMKDDVFLPEYVGVFFSEKKNDVFCTSFDRCAKKKIEDFYSDIPMSDILICKSDPGEQNRIRTGALINKSGITTYSFFSIYCENESSVVFIPRVSRMQKMWVNYKLLNFVKPTNVICIVNLKKGLNTIVFESANTQKTDTLFVRISSLRYEKEVEPRILGDRFAYPNRFGSVYHSTNYYPGEKKQFKMIFFPKNEPNEVKSRKAVVDIYRVSLSQLDEKRQLIYNCEIPTKRTFTIDFSEFDRNEGFSFFCLELKYRYKDGFIYSETVKVFTHYPDKEINGLINFLHEIVRKNESTEYDKLTAKHFLNKFNSNMGEMKNCFTALELLNKINKFYKCGHFDNEIYAPGFKSILFYSDLFESIDWFYAYLPPNYDCKKKYPLVILTSTDRAAQCFHFANYEYENVIAVDISLKGVTLGSYIGDAAFHEVLNKVKNYFKIDNNRVYITGNSNGGAASFAQAQLNPALFAGIYPFAPGGFNPNHAANLSNLRVITVMSDNDNRYNIFCDIEKTMKDIGHKDYSGYTAKGFTHFTSAFLWINRKMFKKLLECKRESFPKSVTFTTSRNRSRKAYWIEIHSIEKFKKVAKIKANWEGDQIFIEVENITGFTVNVPPEVSRECFELTVNNKNVFKFEKDTKKIHIKKQDDIFSLCNDVRRIKDKHKGNGLLDVYLDPMVVCVPNKDDLENEFTKAAATFSKPSTNGYDPVIYSSYPIRSYCDLSNSNDITEKSMVVFDDGTDNLFLEKIRNKAHIKTNDSGYTYKKKKYKGPYCILQIVNSPWNRERNILFIRTNENKLLFKNFFIRKLVMPTYVSDNHPFWGNDAMIFDGKKYSIIYEFGMDIKESEK